MEREALLPERGRDPPGVFVRGYVDAEVDDAEDEDLFYGTSGTKFNSSSSMAPSVDIVRDRSLNRAWRRQKRTRGLPEFPLDGSQGLCQPCADRLCPLAFLVRVPEPSWRLVLGSGVQDFEKKALGSIALLTAMEFDGTRREDMALLQELWKLAMPGESPIGFKRKTEAWKRLGFQSDDPTTDLRGAGMLGLRVAVTVARDAPEVVKGMQEEDILFGAVAVNMTAIVLCHLHILHISAFDSEQRTLVDPSVYPARNASFASEQVQIARAVQIDAMQGFVNLIEGSRGQLSVTSTSSQQAETEIGIRTFTGVCTAGMTLVLAAWRELRVANPKATILDFGTVLYSARVNLVHMLACNPRSMKILQSWASSARPVLVDLESGIP
mmetsp:Transcript_17462/g.34313  ORF Transcript_17462/g.34313 Transcript_17462/m.34313 type:complete len:382 (-) Transcript_17462:564-1709(-)|eukprot:CAMPEP_0171523934 /NCGR_PEP_ID=MMETSP0959-20130129/8736_1 /TAXON_ID=87120 /ORGANISM="Aurantiochytrium limacinum, Strain ATCCMYA-1381" /LENGTH=381 /DNA_ID=CAMNT_0012064547 /DNA_START=35 /DNA_END=1180 /DNA_ORIENTATION=-